MVKVMTDKFDNISRGLSCGTPRHIRNGKAVTDKVTWGLHGRVGTQVMRVSDYALDLTYKIQHTEADTYPTVFCGYNGESLTKSGRSDFNWSIKHIVNNYRSPAVVRL